MGRLMVVEAFEGLVYWSCKIKIINCLWKIIFVCFLNNRTYPQIVQTLSEQFEDKFDKTAGRGTLVKLEFRGVYKQKRDPFAAGTKSIKNRYIWIPL
ncbi:hypothetical protein [Haliscomenobacter sp.]|uniref:hypothetical protein n=1 Tax=Haliscomenobacter sp. TaxID=2717303 RepID=UPI003593D7E5